MAPIELSMTERKVLSYLSRGASRDSAAAKIASFFNITANDALGAIASLRKQNLVIESKNVGSGVIVLATNPLKVKSSMLDQEVVEALRNGEMSAKASGFKRKAFTTDPNTGEIRDANAAPKAPKNETKNQKKGADLGFDIDE